MSSVEIPQGHQAGKGVQEINMGHQPSEIHFIFSCGHKKVAYWGNPYQANNLAEHCSSCMVSMNGWQDSCFQWEPWMHDFSDTVHKSNNPSFYDARCK